MSEIGPRSDAMMVADSKRLTWHIVHHISSVADWSTALRSLQCVMEHTSHGAHSCVTCNLHGNCGILEIMGSLQAKGKGRRAASM